MGCMLYRVVRQEARAPSVAPGDSASILVGQLGCPRQLKKGEKKVRMREKARRVMPAHSRATCTGY